MQFSKFLIGSNKYASILDSIKIIIIMIISVSLLAFFIPYYEGRDSLLYGGSAVALSQGYYGITNDLLKEYGGEPFVPNPSWIITFQNTAIPPGNPGIYGLAAISYLIGGIYGLFYLGPIFGILLVISCERIATKLFGNIAGLVTLVLVATDSMIFLIARLLLTDIIFSLFFILGCYYLITYVHERRDRLILFSSIFFVIATFFRMNGVISFPIEILIVGCYFAFQKIQNGKKVVNKTNVIHSLRVKFSKTKSKKFFKTSVFLFIPWLVFFLFFFSYNGYYFGDPFTNYRDYADIQRGYEGNVSSKFFIFNSERFEWIKFFTVGLLPDTFQSFLLDISSVDVSHFLDKNWLGIFSIFIMLSALGISLYDKKKRTEVVVLIIFIIGTLFFYSANLIGGIPIQEKSPSQDIQERYMIPASILSFLLLSFIITRIWKIKQREFSNIRMKLLSKSFRIGFLVILAAFLIVIFFGSAAVKFQTLGVNFQDPTSFANRYPLDMEGLSENSVIMFQGRRVLEFNAISFTTDTGYSRQTGFNPDLINQNHVQILKKIIDDGYKVYAFKKHTAEEDQFYRYLGTSHGMILKNHSNNFCKLDLVKNLNDTSIKKAKISDDICLIEKT